MLKNILKFTIAGAVALGLAACDSKETKKVEETKVEAKQTVIKVSVIADIIEGSASTNITLNTIWKSLAPNDLAASITPLSTSLNALSINLAIKGAAPIVRGIIAALVPILFPIKNFVRGNKTIINIIKGNDLSVFITTSKIEYTFKFSFNPSLDVNIKIIAKKNPITTAKKVETNDIYIVSPSAGNKISNIIIPPKQYHVVLYNQLQYLEFHLQY